MIKFNGLNINKKSPPQIIAEIGVNHDGNIKKAFRLIDKAKSLGLKFVKFQNFKSENIVSKNLSKAPYQKKNTNNNDSQFQMLKNLELSEDDFLRVKQYCDSSNMIFLSTPYDFNDIDFLIKINTKILKISSSHSVEFNFVKYALDFNRPVILSTGMFNQIEIDKLAGILKNHHNKKTCIMQCTTNYPANLNDSNLNTLDQFKKKFNSILGYSDHTINNTSSIVAVGKGAKIIEKHFTLNTKDDGPDHLSSLDPKNMKSFISDVNNAYACMGSNIKEPTKNEIINSKFMRRSLFTKKFIPKGKKITKEDVCFKRPGNGISPNNLKLILGKIAKSDIKADVIFSLKDLK